MRWMTIVALLFGGAHGVSAQVPSTEEQAARMAALEALLGTWEGSGWQQRGPDPAARVEFDVREEVRSELEGLVYLVRGLGTLPAEGEPAPRVVHQALGTIHWNVEGERYEFQSHTAEGQHTLAELERLEDGRLRWGFEIPQGAIRFTIDLSQGLWEEIGEISFDGESWMQFHDMSLERVAPTAAP